MDYGRSLLTLDIKNLNIVKIKKNFRNCVNRQFEDLNEGEKIWHLARNRLPV